MDTVEKIRLASFMINKAAKDYRANRLVVAWRFLQALRQGFSPTEIAECDLLNTAEAGTRLRDFVSNEELLDFQRGLNPESHYTDTEDKQVFARLCRQHHLPIAKQVGQFDFGSQVDPVMIEPIRQLVARLPSGDYILKPTRGCHGKGVLPVVHQQQPESEEALVEQLRHHCATHREFCHWLIEERLANHRDVLALSPSHALQTVRVVTFVDCDDKVQLVAAQWRLASVHAYVDNFCFGTRLGLLCNIVPETGRIEIAYRGKNFPREFALDAVDRHIETGKILVGERVPLWDEVVALAERAALAFLPSRAIGWDIGLSPAGPVLIEGNRYWDAHNEDGRMRERMARMRDVSPTT
ncbi:sugar-transfer associated ATP-grasp domain-containing protein [Parahaliea mediterranea]|uniref:sugar-transfer associated ATP-grasp domain-containing protein n=1 Tax=Parahaliea mediterranea TaxID=651086 RepID=UPI001300538F|nr:sugar-transfer associated ATP-grasp domain-containing protein [Parahaliea mediterranea]